MAFIVRAGYNSAIRRTQKYVRRLTEVCGGKHILQICLRQKGSPQHTYNLILKTHRRIKAGHSLIKKMMIENNSNITFSP